MPISMAKLFPRLEKHKDVPNLKFTIVEQSQDGKRFNLGKLINVGFDYYLKNNDEDEWTFMFHPIDIFPINGVAPYFEGEHMLKNDVCDFLGYHFRIDQGYYKAFACLKNKFLKLNGFTNNFWGWGAEDDEMHVRLAIKNMKRDYIKVEFDSWGEIGEDNLGSYQSPDGMLGIQHHTDNLNVARSLNEEKMQKDGLSSLTYELIDKKHICGNISHIVVNI